jgi:hypothetical protein
VLGKLTKAQDRLQRAEFAASDARLSLHAARLVLDVKRPLPIIINVSDDIDAGTNIKEAHLFLHAESIHCERLLQLVEYMQKEIEEATEKFKQAIADNIKAAGMPVTSPQEVAEQISAWNYAECRLNEAIRECNAINNTVNSFTKPEIKKTIDRWNDVRRSSPLSFDSEIYDPKPYTYELSCFDWVAAGEACIPKKVSLSFYSFSGFIERVGLHKEFVEQTDKEITDAWKQESSACSTLESAMKDIEYLKWYVEKRTQEFSELIPHASNEPTRAEIIEAENIYERSQRRKSVKKKVLGLFTKK